jgi:hypothetical protein
MTQRMPALPLRRTPDQSCLSREYIEETQGEEEEVQATDSLRAELRQEGGRPLERAPGAHPPGPGGGLAGAEPSGGQLRTPPVDEQQPTQSSPSAALPCEPRDNQHQHDAEQEGLEGHPWAGLLTVPTPQGEPPSKHSDGARTTMGVLQYPTLVCAIRVALDRLRKRDEALALGTPVHAAWLFCPERMRCSANKRCPGDAVEQVYFDRFAEVSKCSVAGQCTQAAGARRSGLRRLGRMQAPGSPCGPSLLQGPFQVGPAPSLCLIRAGAGA